MVSFLVTVRDEEEEFRALINTLQPFAHPVNDEIIVLADDRVTQPIVDYAQHCKIPLHKVKFEGDFAVFKNSGIPLCNREWVCQIDSDEIWSPTLIRTVQEISQRPANAQIVWIPRVNYLRGGPITEEEKLQNNWKFDEWNHLNGPDYQSRVFKKGTVKWEGRVHERLVGAEQEGGLPFDFQYCILHNKELARQRKQIELYNTITR